MIKCDFRNETSICGSPVQIAAELEELMRRIFGVTAEGKKNGKY